MLLCLLCSNNLSRDHRLHAIYGAKAGWHSRPWLFNLGSPDLDRLWQIDSYWRIYSWFQNCWFNHTSLSWKHQFCLFDVQRRKSTHDWKFQKDTRNWEINYRWWKVSNVLPCEKVSDLERMWLRVRLFIFSWLLIYK